MLYKNVIGKGYYAEIFYKMKNFVFFSLNNMKEYFLLITSIIYAIYVFYFDNGIKLNDGFTIKLDHLLQESI